ncbi:thiosulfate sulfurtransferase/rhodanese-like domain-containing protein 3 [Stigmatopora nigra]
MALRMFSRLSRVAPRLLCESRVLPSVFVPRETIHLAGFISTGRVSTTPELWCSQFSSMPPNIDVSYEQLRKLLAAGKSFVIDVREPVELREDGPIPGAINLPLGELPTALQLSPEEFTEKYGSKMPQQVDNIVFTCRRGIRSKTAINIASELGYKDVQHYPGGWQDWAEREPHN